MAFFPYLMFGGNCREAFTRYHEIFGGELELLSMADMPPGETSPTDQTDLIMHAALTFDDGQMLMASDDPSEGFSGMHGMHVNYTTDDPADAKRVFEALAESGTVTMPLEATFWSPLFGVCTDRFGTPWMINTAAPEGYNADRW